MSEVIWVYLERDSEAITDSSIQAIDCACALAEESGGYVEGVCVGGNEDALKAIQAPLKRIYHLVGASFDVYTTDVYGTNLEAEIANRKPSLLIFPLSTQGEDLASWLAAGLGVGILLGAQKIRKHGGRFLASRVEFEGKVAVEYELEGVPVIVSIEEATPQKASGASETPEIERVLTSKPEQEPPTKVIRTEVAKKTVDLPEARVIVGVGAGLGSEEVVKLAKELADLLEGELGATRAAVDAGWVSYDRQIGQTGVKVRPDLYIALGISGAAQHRVGILDSGTIIAVNVDPQAPIFRYSHYCVEGDLKNVLPKLIENIRR